MMVTFTDFLKTRLPHSGILRNSVYKNYSTMKCPQLEVATSICGSWLSLDESMFKMLHNRESRRSIKCVMEDGFPQELREEYVQQLTNMYNKIIFPGQFLPQLYKDVDTAKAIHSCGLHISEIEYSAKEMHKYTRFGVDDHLQHCRNWSKFCGVILLMVLSKPLVV